MGPLDELVASVQTSIADLQSYAMQAAARWQVPWPIFKAMIDYESGWNTGAVSPAGAMGIAQIMPGTASDWKVNPWDPFQALDAAAMHLSEYYTEHGNSWYDALAAYNGGDSPQGIANGIAAGYPAHVLAAAGVGAVSGGSGVSNVAGSGSTSSQSPQTAKAPVNFSPAVVQGILAIAVVAAIIAIAI